MTHYSETGPFTAPGNDLEGTADVPSPITSIHTFLFDAPVSTEGLRLLFRTVCDRFEMEPFDTSGDGRIGPGEEVAFEAATTCPRNNIGGNYFDCTLGMGATFFQPLVSEGLRTLPVDNVVEAEETGFAYAAVDLGESHHVETDTDLLELVADTESQSEWTVAGVLYSDSDTSDPNLVVWDGTATKARWIRFRSISTDKWEDPQTLLDMSYVSSQQTRVANIPQSRILQARIYPSITTARTAGIPINSVWDNLGDILTDNSNLTYINYSDYPVVALDLGRAYVLSDESTVFRKKHDFISGNVPPLSGDRKYWNPDVDANLTYSAYSYSKTD
jgi:hypothetical protein